MVEGGMKAIHATARLQYERRLGCKKVPRKDAKRSTLRKLKLTSYLPKCVKRILDQRCLKESRIQIPSGFSCILDRVF